MQTLCRSRVREKIASSESQDGVKHHSAIAFANATLQRLSCSRKDRLVCFVDAGA